jgi:hypothetical protein
MINDSMLLDDTSPFHLLKEFNEIDFTVLIMMIRPVLSFMQVVTNTLIKLQIHKK